VDESNPVRAVDVFVEALELRELGFDGVNPAAKAIIAIDGSKFKAVNSRDHNFTKGRLAFNSPVPNR
jgi:hypothetical protein